MISSISCPNCGSQNDLNDSFCLSCGSKLPSSTPQSTTDLKEGFRFFDGRRLSIYSVETTVYESNNPDNYYRIKLNRNITKFMAVVLLLVMGSAILGFVYAVLKPSSLPSPTPPSVFYDNFWIIILVVVAIVILIFITLFVQKRVFLRLYTANNDPLGDIVPDSTSKQFQKNSWVFRTSSSMKPFTLGFHYKNSGIAKTTTKSYSVDITKQSNEWFIVKDQQNAIILKGLSEGASRRKDLSRNFVINCQDSLDILFVLFLTQAIVNKYFTEKFY